MKPRSLRIVDGQPVLEPSSILDIDNIMHWLETNLRGDFCISPSFEPKFMAALFYEGFLTIATPAGRSCLLLPKLHQQRSIIEFKDLHVAHKARKHSKQYELSLDKAFPAAVACCIKQHGQNWLLPPMVDSLTFMHKNRVHPQVSVHSVELWKNGQLVAGEIGYLVGLLPLYFFKARCSLV
eukprot:TRINITY_DN8262_c0_g1_i1.p1 TRINITY_DN8262_c0_g1~~TRINITY_DN8262_c0_g1_i1.p1  ORF type:complete len:188 (-),score=16.54 TRINITY_DN8262_c0_g1_i1:348-890(-)